MQLEQPYKSVEVIKGGNPTIKCDIEGDKNPVWRRLDRLIQPEPELKVINSEKIYIKLVFSFDKLIKKNYKMICVVRKNFVK